MAGSDKLASKQPCRRLARNRRLIQVCDILTSGIIGYIPSAAAIVALRQYLLVTKDSSAAARRERYGKTERALRAFLNDEPISKLVSANKELYPLPFQWEIAVNAVKTKDKLDSGHRELVRSHF